MSTFKCCRAVLVVLACVGVVLPSQLWAAPPGQDTRTELGRASEAQAVRDVALGPDGSLRGTVFNVQALRMPGQVVILTRNNRELARVVSDDKGRFEFRDLSGGVYGLTVDGTSRVYRVWTSTAAPPRSIAEVALVTRGFVHRGQRPLADLFVSDPIVLGVILAAAIAIPVAVSNSRSGRPAS